MLRLGLLAENMHNSVLCSSYQAFAQSIGIDIDFQIINIHPEQLNDIIHDALTCFNGLTVTMPYKCEINSYCSWLSPTASLCGAVNTVKIDDGKMYGYNTDGWGLLKYLSILGVSLKDKQITIIGAGGASKSIAYYISKEHPSHVAILNVHKNKAELIAQALGDTYSAHTFDDANLFQYAKESDVFINASSLGQIGHPDFDNLDFIRQMKPSSVIIDVNYSKTYSKLLSAANSYNLQTVSGKGMSICQGIKSFEIWTEKIIPDHCVTQLVEDVK